MELKQELLVEGNDDLHVVAALCNKNNIKENFRIVDCKGIENLLIGLPVRLKSSVKTIGAVIDADADLNARWNSVCSILSASGRYGDIPDECPAEGLILEPVSEGDPKFGLWIMPDNRTSGMLEHFTTMLIPADDDLLPVVDETLSRLESNGMNRYSTVHHEKARIHTWLAWQESPGTPMGLAITKKISHLTALCIRRIHRMAEKSVRRCVEDERDRMSNPQKFRIFAGCLAGRPENI